MNTAIVASWLWMCVNPTWGGCGTFQMVDFGTAEACQAALSSMVIKSNGNLATGSNGKATVAYCRPPYPKEK